MNFKLEPIQYIIFLILIKSSLVMIVSAMLSNFNYFFDRFFATFKPINNRIILAIIFSSTIVVGLILRYTANYHALDFSVPFLFVIGAVLGFLPTLITLTVVSLFIFIFSNEYYYILYCSFSSLIGSFFYSPDIFDNKKIKHRAYLGMLPLALISIILHLYAPPSMMFSLSNRTAEGNLVAVFSDLVSIFLIFFVFEYHYKSIKLMENSFNLNKARLAILSSQINPHFLFNTLNTIASAIRVKPNIARDLVFKLSETLRYVLKTENDFKPLQDEINFISNFVSIENVRFGDQRLNFAFNIDQQCKEFLIPTMILQPIVENAIRHGLVPLTNRRGLLEIFAKLLSEDKNEFLEIKIIDNGVGIEKINDDIFKKGIGLSNVNDRLKLLFGKNAKIEINSIKNQGTKVTLLFPKKVSL